MTKPGAIWATLGLGSRSALIDLHTHTNESDGSCSPAELVSAAARAGIEVLAITDHDTFEGFDKAVEPARAAGIALSCGIELSTKLNGRSVHLLGYFPEGADLTLFRTWVLDMQASRRDRNVRLAARLREFGFDITLKEAEALGRGMTGRPHFAQLMVEKGYVRTLRQAFEEYLDESAQAYVFRREPHVSEGIQQIRDAGGVASLAHPARVNGDVSSFLQSLCDAGLNAIEAYHSDHSPEETEHYIALARRHGLLVTGGSDFHGDLKPEVQIGAGHWGKLNIPREVWENLRTAAGLAGNHRAR